VKVIAPLEALMLKSVLLSAKVKFVPAFSWTAAMLRLNP